MRATALVTILLATTSLAHADAVTYGGHITGADFSTEAYLELTQPADGAVVGRYTFFDDGTDIPLHATSFTDTTATLEEEASCTPGACVADEAGNVDYPLAAIWQVEIDYDAGELRGTRTPVDTGEVQTIDMVEIGSRMLLEPASTMELRDHSARLSYDTSLSIFEAPYERLKLDFAFYFPGPGEVMNGIEYDYYTDERVGMTYPRIRPVNGAEQASEALGVHFARATLSAFDCKSAKFAGFGVNDAFSSLGGHSGGWEDELITLTHLSPRLVSWTQSGSLYCTGAHPHNHIDSYTIDFETGQPLAWQKLISAWVPYGWSGEPADPAAAEADPERHFWGPDAALLAFITERIPADVFDDHLLELCTTQFSMTEHVRLHVDGDDTIVVSLSGYPHVAGPCNGELFRLPVKQMKPFLTLQARDYFPALG